MSILTDFAQRFSGPPAAAKDSPMTAVMAVMLPAAVLRSLHQHEALLMQTESKLSDERETLKRLEAEHAREAALAEQSGNTSKADKAYAKVVKQREVLARLRAAKAGAEQLLAEDQAAEAAEREAQAQRDIETILAEMGEAARGLDRDIESYVANRSKVLDCAVRLRAQGVVGCGLERLAGKAQQDVNYLTRGATGGYPPTYGADSVGIAKSIPTLEEALAVRARNRKVAA